MSVSGSDDDGRGSTPPTAVVPATRTPASRNAASGRRRGDDSGCGNGQTDLVQPRRPLQGLRRVLIEPPRRGHLLQALLGGARHTLRLPAVHMVARRQTGNGTRTNILMTHAAEQVMKQPLAQRPVGHLQALDLQCFERGNQNRQTAGQHRGAVLADTEGLQVPDVTDAEQHLAQAIKRVERDIALAPAARLQHRTDGAHRPGGAIGGLPAKRTELRRHRLELETRRRFARRTALDVISPLGK